MPTIDVMTTFRPLCLVCLLGGAAPASALVVEFNYDYDSSGFFAPGSTARTALEAAGAFYASVLGDSLLPISSAGDGSFNAFFSNPSVFANASTLKVESIENFSIAADTVLIMAGAVNLDPFGAGTLAVAGPGFQSVSGSPGYINAAISRGQGPSGVAADIQGATATDFALWGGFVSFDLGRDWHFGVDSTPSGGRPDFLSVALHELGHVFGLGTANSWFNLTAGGSFLGANAQLEQGGPVPLQNGNAHWAEGVTSTVADVALSYILNPGAAQEAALDPTLINGQRKLMTDLDLAALADIGWEVTAVPLPAGAWLLMSGLVAVGIGRRRHDLDRAA